MLSQKKYFKIIKFFSSWKFQQLLLSQATWTNQTRNRL
jgi:hypothetical protein